MPASLRHANFQFLSVLCLFLSVSHRWQEERDARDVRALLNGIRNGFKRPAHNGLDGIGGEVRGHGVAAVAGLQLWWGFVHEAPWGGWGWLAWGAWRCWLGLPCAICFCLLLRLLQSLPCAALALKGWSEGCGLSQSSS